MLEDEDRARLEETRERLFGSGEQPEWVEEAIRSAVAAGEGFDDARRRIYMLYSVNLDATPEAGIEDDQLAWRVDVETIGTLLRSYAPTLSNAAVQELAREFNAVEYEP